MDDDTTNLKKKSTVNYVKVETKTPKDSTSKNNTGKNILEN